jgi:hypothetical protein
MLKLEARPEASKFMSIASPLLALAITVVIGTILFIALGKDPMRGLQRLLHRAGEERLCAVGAGHEGHAAAAHRARPVGVFPLQRVEHRRRGAVHRRRHLRQRRGHAGRARHRPLDRRAGAARRHAGRHGLGGHRGAAARPLQRQRDPRQPDDGLHRRHGAELPRLRPLEGPGGLQLPADHHLPEEHAGAALFDGSRVNLGLPIALVLVAAFWVLLFRTYAGFQLQVGGLAPAAARYAGFSSRKALWMALLLSGGMAGLAGALEAAGPLGQLTPHVPAGYGFAAIIVAFVGRCTRWERSSRRC